MKTNKYILPVQEFKKPVKTSFFEVNPKKNNFGEVSSFLKKESNLIYSSIIINKELINNIEELVFSIFTNPIFLSEAITDIFLDKQNFIKKISFFVTKNQPIECTLMAFPFKIPVPLKTNRITPDFGELLSLNFLYTLNSIIKKIYKPGIIINIITEDIFYPFAFVLKEEADSYQEQLEKLNVLFNFNSVVKLHRLSKLIEKFPNFYDIFNSIKIKNKKENDINLKIKEVLPSMFRIVNTRSYKKDFLYGVYQKRDNDIQDKIFKKATEGSILYISFLETRDKIHLLETVFPENIRLSYTPKAGRFGIKPGGPNMKLLPIHGVPVLRNNENSFSIEYLFDIENDGCSYKAVYFENDIEEKPFFYIEN